MSKKYTLPPRLFFSVCVLSDVALSDNVGKGSGRSIKGMNLVDALCYCSEHLVKFGGHELAAGLSVTRDQLPAFVEKINEFARINLSEADMVPVIEADCDVDFTDVTLAFAESLQLLEPYGVSNPVPQFIMRGATVAEISGVSDGKHSRITLTDGKGSLSAMYFSNSPSSLGIYSGDKVDVLFSIGINEWMDRKSVQLIVRDIKVSVSCVQQYQSDRQRFEEIKSGSTFTADENVLPSRNDFVNIYRLVQGSLHVGADTFTHKDLLSKLSAHGNSARMTYIKLKFIILVLKELNLIQIDEFEDEVYRFKLNNFSTKQNLEKSNILRKLRSQMR